MCGIVASINSNSLSDQDISECKDMLLSLEKRGPDASNYILKDHVFLGHTRLSIIDTRIISNQPFSDNEESLTILFNGEIYNYKYLKRELISKGYTFKTSSDTEVVLNLYKEYGTESFTFLRGMFSILIFDKNKNEIIIARDLVGIKPLYYYFNKNKLLISSQVKTLLNSEIEKEIDFESKIDFYLMGYVIEPKTIFKNIKSLKAGNYKKFKIVKNESIYLLETKKIETKYELSDKNLQTHIDETIKCHLISDVEVGLFLSSGIDSITIASHLKKYNKTFSSINLAFEEYIGKKEDESILAQKVSKLFNFNFIQVNSNSKELLEIENEFFKDMDQPTIDGLNTWVLCNHAKKTKIKVFLSGLGLDELLFGYKTREYINILKILKPFTKILKILSPILNLKIFNLSRKSKYFYNYLSSFADNYILKRSNLLFEEISFLKKNDIEHYKKTSHLYKILNEIEKSNNNFNQKIYLSESELYMKNMLLRDSDWAGMANSLEIRVPFSDSIFRENISKKYHQLKNINKKVVLSTLPLKIKKILINKKKTGFNIPKYIFVNEKDVDNIKYTEHVFKRFLKTVKL